MKIILNVQELHIHPPGCNALIKSLEQIMTTQAEIVSTLEGVTTQLVKIGTETTTLLNKIDDLTAALADAGKATPEVEAAVAALQAQAVIVDDLVPDVAP